MWPRAIPLAACVSACLLAACAGNSFLPRLATTPSPHEKYVDALRGNGLSSTALARDFVNAADAAVARPLSVSLPMRESGYFAADRAAAVGYRMELQRGRKLSIDVTFEASEPAQL